MSTPPNKPINKYLMHTRVADVEKLAANCDTAIRELTARFDRQPPKGDPGATGPKGDSITGPAGRDGKNGADGVGYPGATGQQGPAGADGKDGHDAPQRQELDALLLEYRRDIKNLRAEIADLKANVDLTRKAFEDMNTKASDYIAFLQTRVADRVAAGNTKK